jgi:uroporphyrinogen-III synthase
MRILITRPREDAAALAEKLKARGHEVLVEPMLEIRLVADAKVDLSDVQALLFTSANGVRAFAAAETRRDLTAFCVGDTTAATAREVGFAKVESASGNVDDLARLVRERLNAADGALLHAAGAAVAGDLAGALAQDGFTVRRAVLYAAEPVNSLSPVAAAALKARQVDMVVFFSARTAETFARLVREAGLAPALSRTVALGLSPAVLQALVGLPWAMTESARQPQEADLIRAIARHKIIAQLEGKPVEEEVAPEIVFGRRADDKGDTARETPSSRAPATPARPSRLVAAVAWLAALLSLGTLVLVLIAGERSTVQTTPAAMLRLETRLTALERQIANLPVAGPQSDPQAEARLKSLADQVAALERRPPVPGTADLERRLDAMEKASVERAPASDPGLPRRLQALEQSLAELQARPAVTEEVAARLAALEVALDARPDVGQIAVALAENRRQSSEIARLQEQIAAMTAGASRTTGREGLLLAVGQLREAIRQGRPFTTELATVQALAADDPTAAPPIAVLQALASRSVSTREALQARFGAIAAEAGRAAQMADLVADAPADDMLGRWWSAVIRRLSSVVSVRRVGDVAGDSPAARLARAEQAVAAGNLAGGVATLEGLPGPAGNVVAGWRAEAQARIELDRAGEALFAAALAASGGVAAGTGQ